MYTFFPLFLGACTRNLSEGFFSSIVLGFMTLTTCTHSLVRSEFSGFLHQQTSMVEGFLLSMTLSFSHFLCVFVPQMCSILLIGQHLLQCRKGVEHNCSHFSTSKLNKPLNLIQRFIHLVEFLTLWLVTHDMLILLTFVSAMLP